VRYPGRLPRCVDRVVRNLDARTLLRTLQRCGIRRATILSSTSERIADELARPHGRAQLALTLRIDRMAAEIEQSSTFGRRRSASSRHPRRCRLRQSLIAVARDAESPAVLVDSAVPSKLQPLVTSGPKRTAREGLRCGQLLQRDWVSTRMVLLENAINNGLEQNAIAALDVTDNPPTHRPAAKAQAVLVPARLRTFN